MWFRDFIGMKVQFPGRQKSNWILSKQISEHAESYTKEECQDIDDIPEARAVFLCSKVDGHGPKEAVMKVLMQIPWAGTDMESKEQISAQKGTSETAAYEADALEMLTEAKCSSTPTLLSTKTTIQSPSMWVPGGYLGFVLMTKLPGERVHRIADLNPQEREAMRQAFKKAWIECYASGIVAGDGGIRNLLWDRKNQKCYIVDFGMWYPAEEFGPWRDGLFISWNLKIYMSGREWAP